MRAYNRKRKPLGSTKLKYRYVGTYLRIPKGETEADGYYNLFEGYNRNRYMTQGINWTGRRWQNGKYKGYEILNECWDKHLDNEVIKL